MALRCLLFTSDEGTAEPIRQVLASLGVEGEYCTEGAAAVEEVTNKNFQIVIIDWDKQPEAGLLLSTARERKAAARPLTLAIVSDDLSVPKALQAGANSILRKPILINQVNDTLTTARDLLRAKQESAASAAHAAAAGVSVSPTAPTGARPAGEVSLSADKSLEPPLSLPQPQNPPKGIAPEFVTALEPVIPPKTQESIAAPVAEEKVAPSSMSAASPSPPGGPRGLEWYLKTRLGTTTATEVAPTPEPVQAPAPSTRANSDLLSFDQMPVLPPERTPAKSMEAVPKIAPERKANEHGIEERKKEAELFAYMEGESGDSADAPRPKSRLGKGAILFAFVLAGSAIVAAPQAPWHAQMRGVWARSHQTIHSWLYPQPVTTPPAPAAHEDFGRAGDEYKLPVSENIPDATTDPSQIQVVPVVDPTAKKPTTDPTAPVQLAPDGSTITPTDQPPAPAVQVIPTNPEPAGPGPSNSAIPVRDPMATPSVSAPPHQDVPASVSAPPSSISSVPLQPAPPRYSQPHRGPSTGNVPSSLNSQLASMTPELSGNKAAETAMASIEPVAVPEAAERALLTEQPALSYPATAKGQQATVILQVLIGRDGTVQDAKFLQGSLAFARAAIDGVKPWKFKPYLMNGRPVSVQTSLTISFKPGQ